MTHAVARLIEPLLRLLFPARGRHRATDAPRTARPSAVVAPRRPGVSAPLLRGEDSRLVRPYLVAHEHREETRRQRARRRALWLAVHGIDVGPRLIHGVEVSA